MTRHHLYRGRHAVGLTGLLLMAVGCSNSDNTQAPIIPPPDNAPPIAPSAPAVSKSNADAYAVAWAANTESDLAGYRVYVYEPNPESDSAYRLLNPDQLVTRNRYSARTEANIDGSNPSELYLRVTAVDQSGNEVKLESAGAVVAPDLGRVRGGRHARGERDVDRTVPPAGRLWLAWPKKASGVPTDLSDGIVRSAGLDAGVVDTKVCAIDATWSGLMFVRRLKDR